MNPENPYLSTPSAATSPVVAAGGAPAPRGFTAVPILMVILGVMGVYSSLGQSLTMLSRPAPGMPAVPEHWFLIGLFGMLWHVVASLALLVGAIRMLRRDARGPGLLNTGAVLAIPYQLISLVLTLIRHNEELGPFRNRPVPEGEEAILTVMFWLYAGLLGLWSMVVVAMLAGTIYFVRRSDVREACTKKPDET